MVGYTSWLCFNENLHENQSQEGRRIYISLVVEKWDSEGKMYASSLYIGILGVKVKAKKYLNDVKNIEARNNLLKFIVLLLVIGIFLQSMFSIYTMNKQRTVVIPSHVEKEFSIQGNKASPEYINMMAKYVVELKENFTPATIKDRFAEFLSFIAPQAYGKIKVSLLTDIDKYIQYSASSWFTTQDVRIKGDRVYITGVKKSFIQNKQAESRQVRFMITYKINSGKFEVVKYEEVDASKPIK